jgi:hypothetical protein
MNKIDKEFRELTEQKLPTSSRLNLYNILQDLDTNYVINIFKTVDINDYVKNHNDFFIIHTAEDDEWWDNVSYKYYDTPSLWYIICIMNNILNPYEEIEKGQLIKVIKKIYLYNILKDIKNISEL